MKRILIIEDDKVKIEKLKTFFEDYNYIILESYHSGLEEIIHNHECYSFLILDMTIPLWEKDRSDLGGNYEQFGGERILREMKRKKIFLTTILVSMFGTFTTSEGTISFNDLDGRLLDKYNKFYIGAVHYNASDDSWKESLKTLIQKVHDK